MPESQWQLHKKKPMIIWADVRQKLRNLPSESKTSDKAKLIFQQAIQSGGQEFN